MQQSKRMTRRDKLQEKAEIAPVKSKFNDQLGYKSFKLTDSQREFANKIIENDMVVCSSPAGTGKTLTVLHTFVQMYLANPSLNITVVRTPVEAGTDKIGFLPGEANMAEKLGPHFASAQLLLNKLLNKGKVETDTDHRIHFKIPNFLLGSTLDNTLCLVDECFTDKHELLTTTGWKNVREINETDIVCQFNEDGSSAFVKPSRVVHKEYKGNVVEYAVGDVNYSVTENHRLIFKNRKNETTEKLAKDSTPTTWRFLTSSKLVSDNEFNITDSNIRLDVAMQADGSFSKRGNSESWQIQMSKLRKLDRFSDINSESSNFHEVASSPTKGNVAERRRFYSSSYKPVLIDSTKEKNFDFNKLVNLSLRQRQLFIEELAHWDGSVYNKNGNFLYSSTNKHNVDVVQGICAISGYATTINKKVDNRKESYKDCYKLMIKKTVQNASTQEHDKLKRVVEFDGVVHCVTVPSGMVLTRCNGKVHISGNCQELSPLIMKLILERIGVNSKVVVLGDPTQRYSGEGNRNGLTDVINKFFVKDGSGNYYSRFDGIDFHEFGIQDVQRSDFVKTVLTAYSN